MGIKRNGGICMKEKKEFLDKEKVNMIWLKDLDSAEKHRLCMDRMFVGHLIVGTIDRFQFSEAPCWIKDQSDYERINEWFCVDFDSIGEEKQMLLENKCRSYTRVDSGYYVEDTKVYDRVSCLQKVNKKRY